MGVVVTGIEALAAGALDGFAASKDHNAGRHWDTTGMDVTGTPVIEWGFAPAVQVGSVALGLGAQLTGRSWGRGLFDAGVGMLARAFTFKLAQRGQPSPAPTQGYVTDEPVPAGTPASHYVSTYGYVTDEAPPPGTPRSHYVSTYGDRQAAFGDRQTALEPSDELGGRIDASLAPG